MSFLVTAHLKITIRYYKYVRDAPVIKLSKRGFSEIVYLYLNSLERFHEMIFQMLFCFLFESHFALTFLLSISPWIIVVYLEIPRAIYGPILGPIGWIEG